MVITMTVLAAIVSLILSFIVKEDLKRLKYEKEQGKNKNDPEVQVEEAKPIEKGAVSNSEEGVQGKNKNNFEVYAEEAREIEQVAVNESIHSV